MKSLVRRFAFCSVIAILSSLSMSLLLYWGAQLPRIGPVSFAEACERMNTLTFGVEVFAIVFLLGASWIVLRESKPRQN